MLLLLRAAGGINCLLWIMEGNWEQRVSIRTVSDMGHGTKSIAVRTTLHMESQGQVPFPRVAAFRASSVRDRARAARGGGTPSSWNLPLKWCILGTRAPPRPQKGLVLYHMRTWR